MYFIRNNNINIVVFNLYLFHNETTMIIRSKSAQISLQPINLPKSHKCFKNLPGRPKNMQSFGKLGAAKKI